MIGIRDGDNRWGQEKDRDRDNNVTSERERDTHSLSPSPNFFSLFSLILQLK